MLQKLKVECGHNTTAKISKMFTDMTLSKELMDSFAKSKGKEIAGIEFQCEILTNGTWPTDPAPACNVPKAMK